MINFGRGAITPQKKTISVNDKFGNRGIKKQQGSTVVKYDTLPLDGRTEYRFFENSNTRDFPFSNCGTDGNKLGVGYSMVVERAYLSLVAQAEGVFDSVEQLTLAGTNANILLAEFNFFIANSQVIRTLPIQSWLPEFNKLAENNLNTNYEFDTQIVIPPLLEFVATLRLPAGVKIVDTFIRLTIEGSGAIIAPRNTF
jgi:hypothetical protein